MFLSLCSKLRLKRRILNNLFFPFCSSSIDPSTFRQTVKKFVREEIIPNASYYDKTGEYPWKIIKKAHELGFMNTDLPEEMGGLNLPLETKVQIFEDIGYGDTGIGTSLMVNELAQIPLKLGGSDFLKEKYLQQMLKKPIIASYAVTESEAGSDLAHAKLKAERQENYYILNGTKVWITNAGVANWYFVLARTNFNKDTPTSQAFTGFVVERKMDGVFTGEKESNMGQRCSDTRSLTLQNVKVPLENVVGKVGEGFLLVMKAFDRIRPIVASMACGLAQRALDESTAYSLQRKTFGKFLADHQAISFKLADMAINLEATRELIRKSAQMADKKNADSTYYSSCAKVFATDSAFKAASEAVQIFGGNGFNTEYPVEKLLRDSKLLQIYGGTNEIQRVIIGKRLCAKYK